ncbi:hypothetical protein D3C84_197230 [compost metagenome]
MKLLWCVWIGSSTEACTDATAAKWATALQPFIACDTNSASATLPSINYTHGLPIGKLCRFPVLKLSRIRTG